jgi:hypothetical protein
LICAVVVGGGGVATGSAQGNLTTVAITEIDISSFPQVTLQALARDSTGVPLATLPTERLALEEDGVPQKLSASEPIEGGLRVAFVVDPGDGAYYTGEWLSEVYAKAREDILLFLIGRPWMTAEADQALILVQEAEKTVPLARASSDPEGLAERVQAYEVPEGVASRSPEPGRYTRAALLAALKEIRLTRPGEGSDRYEAIILYTPGMRADLAEVAEEAIDERIPIHVVLTRDQPTTYWDKALRPLAEVTGGAFIATYESSDVEPLFEQLDGYRTQHRITYRSASSSLEARAVTLRLQRGPELASVAYKVALLPPQVEIIEPEPGATITRRPLAESDSSLEADPVFLTVRGQVIWADGYPRRLQGASLLVEGLKAAEAQVAESRIEAIWDVRAYNAEEWEQVNLQLEAVDELGMQARSVERPIALRYVPASEGPSARSGLRLPERGLLYASMALALLSLGVAAYLFFNRGRVSPILQEAREGVADFIDRVTGRRTALVPRAYLVPMEGFEEPPTKPYEIYGTTAIGRSRRHADLLFHISEEDSPISRLHCTLLDEDDHFAIRDEDSSNGTLLNGEKLPPLEPVVLREGDVIDITPVERGGLRFMFQTAKGEEFPFEQEEEVRLTRPRRRPRTGFDEGQESHGGLG